MLLKLLGGLSRLRRADAPLGRLPDRTIQPRHTLIVAVTCEADGTPRSAPSRRQEGRQLRTPALFLVALALPATTYAQAGDLVTVDATHTVSDSTVTHKTIPLGGGSQRFFSKCSADCPAGYSVVGGGYSADSKQLTIRASQPWESSGQEGWAVTVEHAPGTNVGFNVFARCMRFTPTSPLAGSFVLRSALDDHTNKNAADYQVTISLNGTTIFSGNPGVDHGSPAGTVFTNFGDLRVSFDKTLLKDGQNILRVTLSGVASGDWFAWDYATIEGTKIESATRWGGYSQTGVDGVYGDETREWEFDWPST